MEDPPFFILFSFRPSLSFNKHVAGRGSAKQKFSTVTFEDKLAYTVNELMSCQGTRSIVTVYILL